MADGYPNYDITGLALFSGRTAASYENSAYVPTALAQALLLFKIGTCLASLDDLSDDQKMLVANGIYQMADNIYLSQPFQEIAASPFTSENIGSYSYGKTAAKVAAGEPTDVMWFDLAVGQVGVCGDFEDTGLAFGGIEVFENDGHLVRGGSGFNVRYLAPSEMNWSRQFGFDPAGNRVLAITPGTPGSGMTGPTIVEDPDNPGYYHVE